MRSLLMLLSALIVAAISMYAFAQTRDEARPIPQSKSSSDAFEPFESKEREDVAQAPADEVAEQADKSSAEKPAAGEQALRERYLMLVQQNAELMDRDVLREEISRLERGIKDLKAAAELARTRADLQALIQTYPDTPAAATAQMMLHLAEPHDHPHPGGAGHFNILPNHPTPIRPTPDPQNDGFTSPSPNVQPDGPIRLAPSVSPTR